MALTLFAKMELDDGIRILAKSCLYCTVNRGLKKHWRKKRLQTSGVVEMYRGAEVR